MNCTSDYLRVSSSNVQRKQRKKPISPHLQRRGIISDTALEELSAHSALGPIYAFYIAAIMECNTCSRYHRGRWRQCRCCGNNSSNGSNSTSNNNKNNRDINRLQQSQQINCHSDTLSLVKVKDKVIVDKHFSAILSKLMDRQLSYLWTNNLSSLIAI